MRDPFMGQLSARLRIWKTCTPLGRATQPHKVSSPHPSGCIRTKQTERGVLTDDRGTVGHRRDNTEKNIKAELSEDFRQSGEQSDLCMMYLMVAT